MRSLGKLMVLTIVLGMVLLSSQTSLACSFHFGIGEDEQSSVPGAMQVVLSSLFLEKSGDIETVEVLPPNASFQRASWWLTLLAMQLAEGEASEVLEPNAYILLVDAMLWTQLESGNRAAITIDIPEPHQPEQVVMMTQSGLNALVSNGVSFKQAQTMGLVRIYSTR